MRLLVVGHHRRGLGRLDETHGCLVACRTDPHRVEATGPQVPVPVGVRPVSRRADVTWVLSGVLEHRDSEGDHGVITPGLAQRMSAGTGIRHSEHNPSSTTDVHFLQMWVPPDTDGIDPGDEQLDVSAELELGGTFPIASGKRLQGAITIFRRDAVLWGGRLAPGVDIHVPVDRHVHQFVARGSGRLDPGGALGTGDAARLHDPDGATFTAGPDGAEVSNWATA